jgi:hypothetical protein
LASAKVVDNPKNQAFWGEQAVSNSKQALWFGVLMLAGQINLHFFDIDHHKTSLSMKLDLLEALRAAFDRRARDGQES